MDIFPAVFQTQIKEWEQSTKLIESGWNVRLFLSVLPREFHPI